MFVSSYLPIQNRQGFVNSFILTVQFSRSLSLCLSAWQLIYYITSFRVCQVLFSIFLNFFLDSLSRWSPLFSSLSIISHPELFVKYFFEIFQKSFFEVFCVVSSDSFCIIPLSNHFVKRFSDIFCNSVKNGNTLLLFNMFYEQLAQANANKCLSTAPSIDNIFSLW